MQGGRRRELVGVEHEEGEVGEEHEVKERELAGWVAEAASGGWWKERSATEAICKGVVVGCSSLQPGCVAQKLQEGWLCWVAARRRGCWSPSRRGALR